jgi:transposase
MMDRGVPADAIMAALDLGRSTFFSWQALYRSGGAEALTTVGANRSGNPKLTEPQMRQLRTWIVNSDPRQFGFEFALWTRPIVGEVISREFGVRMTPQGVGKLLGRLGLSPQRPLYRAYQQDPDLVAEWKETTFPRIREQARAEGADLYFVDEAAVRTDHHAGTTWAPVGRTPVVAATGERDSVNMISAVTPRGELKFNVFRGKFNAAAFVEFLKKLVQGAPKPVYVIADNASPHRAKLVTEYVDSTEGALKLFFLPPYSPELNPDEWVWKNLKNDRVGKKPVRRKTEFFELVTRSLEELQQLPEVIRGFFQDPALAYIHSP